MAEYEELRLTVSLVDNASAGLAKLNEQIRQLGSGANATHLEKFKRQQEDITGKSKEMGAVVEALSGKIGATILRFTSWAGAIEGIRFGIDAATEKLREFTNAQIALAQVSAQTGIVPAQFKDMSEQMQRAGLSAAQAERNIRGIMGAMADVQRVQSEIRNRMLGRPQTPEDRQAMEGLFGDLARLANDPAAFTNRVKQAADSVYNELIKRGYSREYAAARRREFEAEFGAANLEQMAEQFGRVTAAQKRMIDESIKAGKDYQEVTTHIRQNWERITDLWATDFITNSPWMSALRNAASLVDHIGDALERYWQKFHELPNIFYPGGPMGMPKGGSPTTSHAPWASGLGGGARAPGKNINAVPDPIPGAQGAFDWSALPESTNLEDRRGAADDRRRALAENTAELKRLNDWLQGGGGGGGGLGLISGGTGGGGGLPLGTGVGGAVGGGLPGFPGGAALRMPNLGGGAGGGGGRAPYGSHVGPGTGSGAGDTPATGGTQQQGGGGMFGPGGFAGGAAAGGGAGGGGDGGGGARQELMDEVNRDPATKQLMMQMMATEGGGAATVESLMNRTAMIRQKIPGYGIKDELKSGFYGPINSGKAQRRNISPAEAGKFQQDIDKVVGGSNIIQGRTNQGMITDPGANAPGRVKVPGSSEVYNYWSGRRRGVDFSTDDSRRFAEQQSRTIPGGQQTAPQTPAAAVHEPGLDTSGIRDISREEHLRTGGAMRGDPQGLLVHHTGGREKGAEGVGDVLRQRGLSVQYVIDRDGNITRIAPEGQVSYHAGKLEKSGGRFGNFNMEGVEVIARGERDVSETQRAAVARLTAERSARFGWDPRTSVWGHGELTGHKEADEGLTARMIREGRLPLPDRAALDRDMGNEVRHTVHGTGKITVDVNAPKGTAVGAAGGGLFKATEINRNVQMEPAKAGPAADLGGGAAGQA
jgi:hypothetical protein